MSIDLGVADLYHHERKRMILFLSLGMTFCSRVCWRQTRWDSPVVRCLCGGLA